MPTLNILLSIAVGVIFLGFWTLVFIILYHLTRFGVGVQPKRFAAVFLFGAIIIFAVALISFVSIDLSIIANLR